MDVTYNINNPRALNLGHQYDHNVRKVTFTGFTPVNDTNTIYLKFEGIGLYPLQNLSLLLLRLVHSKDNFLNLQATTRLYRTQTNSR